MFSSDEKNAPRRASRRRGSHFKENIDKNAAPAVMGGVPSSPRVPAGVPAYPGSVPASTNFSVGPASTSDDAPRPAPLDDTSSFKTLGGGEGAFISDRSNASQSVAAARANRHGQKSSMRLKRSAQKNMTSRETRVVMSKRQIAIISAAVLLIAVIAGFFIMHLLNKPALQMGGSTRVERTQTKAENSISYDGRSYFLKKNSDGTYSLAQSTKGSSEALELAKLPGTPAGFVLYDGALIIPENLPDGTWDIMAWTMGDGSVATQLVGSDGKPVAGRGTIKKVELKEKSLVLTDADNQTKKIPLSQ